MMNRYRKLWKSLPFLLLLLASTLTSQAATVDECDNYIYVNDVTAAPGSTVTMSVCMKNNVSMVGYQFDMYFPDGLDIDKENDKYRISLSEKRTDATKSDIFAFAKQKDGAMRVLCASTTNALISDYDGEVCTMKLKIGEDVALGTYTIAIRTVYMADKKATNYNGPDEYTFNVVVTDAAPTYDKGYAVGFTPFLLNDNESGVTADLNFKVDGEATSIKTIDFDLSFPSEWYTNTMISDVVKNSSLSSRFYKLSDPTDNEDGTYHFTLTANNAQYYFGAASHETTKVGSFTLYKDGGGDDGSYSIADGMHTVKITNVVATDADGNTYSPAPYVGDVYVGSVKATLTDGAASFHGDYSSTAADMINQSLVGVDAAVVDLTNVSEIAEGTSISTSNPNAVILINDGLELGNTNNVIADGTCKSFALTDGYAFSAPKSFTAESASYKRTANKQWGTICLPYAVKSDESIQYYALNEVDVVGGTMVFAPVDEVASGSPAVYCLSDASCISLDIEAANVEINTMAKDVTTGASDWNMKGTFAPLTISPSDATDRVYYIAENKFWLGNQQFNVPAYRGYFETSYTAGSQAKSFNIGTNGGTTGIDGVVAEGKGDNFVFDLNGRLLSSPAKGQLNIINGKKTYVK